MDTNYSMEQRHNDDVIIAKLESLEKFLMLKISNSEEELKLLREQVNKNGERIYIVELWQANSVGKMSLLAGLSTIVGAIIITFITWVLKHF